MYDDLSSSFSVLRSLDGTIVDVLGLGYGVNYPCVVSVDDDDDGFVFTGGSEPEDRREAYLISLKQRLGDL